MDDLIRRPAAIEAMCELMHHWFGGNPKDEIREIKRELEKLPSAQPEQPSEIQDILDYLDTVLHPLVSPEHWNIYSELHDMIAALPSTQPERKVGKWVEQPTDGRFGKQVECSECGEVYWAWMANFGYCPNCGADMREG